VGAKPVAQLLTVRADTMKSEQRHQDEESRIRLSDVARGFRHD
jgi:hypothetical protein